VNLDFLIVGAMKAGSTSFYNSLTQDPDIFMPRNKEPMILSDPRYSPEWASDMYMRYMRKGKGNQIFGEASTTYSQAPLLPRVPERAYELFGADLKIIYLVRDPIERILSHIRHDVGAGKERDVACAISRSLQHYIDVSRYHYQISLWKKCFSEENIKVVGFEKYAQDNVRSTCEVLDFLKGGAWQAEPTKVFREKIHNKSEDRRVAKGVVRIFHESVLYQAMVKPIIPSTVRHMIKVSLTSKSKVTTRSEVMSLLGRENLSAVEEDARLFKKHTPKTIWEGWSTFDEYFSNEG